MIEKSGDSHLQNPAFFAPASKKNPMAGVCETQWSLPHGAYGLQAFPKKQTQRFGSKPRDFDQKKLPEMPGVHRCLFHGSIGSGWLWPEGWTETWTMGYLSVKGNKSWRDPFSTSIVVGGRVILVRGNSLRKSDLVTECWMPMIKASKQFRSWWFTKSFSYFKTCLAKASQLVFGITLLKPT